MTEEDAKKHQCWRDTSKSCVASKCMAWKWGRLHDPRERQLWSKRKGERVNAAYGDDAEWRLVDPDSQIPEQHGTCSALHPQSQ